MKHNHTNKGYMALGFGVAVFASTLLCSSSLFAADTSISGELSTIFRMRTTIDKKDIYPAYEYLRLNVVDTQSDGSAVTFNLGAWGRTDLSDKSGNNRTDGDLQYANLIYHAPKSNAFISFGRQFISEGVATERIDGIHTGTDFDLGFRTAVFAGKTVGTEPNIEGGGLIYGTRISQTDKKYYTLGLSVLRSDRENGDIYREEEGLDLWLRPHKTVDITGRSSYNSLTEGWMENAYTFSYSPLPSLRLSADYSHINFKDYLSSVTTSALSINSINSIWKSNEQQTAVGANASYSGIKNLTIAADYKFFSYDQSGDSNYFGGKATYSFPEELVVGGGFHRMKGEVDKLRYIEFRAFASKKIGHADLTIDASNVNYDKEINGIRNSYTITGAAGYEVNHKLKIGADIEVSKNPDFDNEVRGLIKAIYTFDSKYAAEGGTKSEK